MTKSLVKYKRNLPARTPIGTIISIIIIGLIIYIILRNRTSSTAGTYQNTKKWFIKYNEDGLPVEITKTVNAKVV